MTSITLDQVLDLAQQLDRRARAELIARLAHSLATAEPPAHVSARDLAAAAPSWAGDDLEERLAEVYATRTPVEA